MTVADLHPILEAFGFDAHSVRVSPISTGHINHTYRIIGSGREGILQRINNKVFTKPEVIASNLELARLHLANSHPDYLFIAPEKTREGSRLFFDRENNPWRLYNYIPNTITHNEVSDVQQATEAAIAFARFGKYMQGADLPLYRPTIERFHDLSLRFEQFEASLVSAKDEWKEMAQRQIKLAIEFKTILAQYQQVIKSGVLRPGIFHNDTKINNVLFDATSNRAVAVIDLDTVMEGYFIYDLGDLIRTIVSPVSEEERDLSKIVVRTDFLRAVISGYLTEMGDALTESEQKLGPFAGLMMTYIMALRFLADFLRGNTYYHITYPEQNLVRAKNQLRLIELLYNT